ncbi:MAG: hypothetical protein Q9227_000610 [Pyrenula ochraceoflavens]
MRLLNTATKRLEQYFDPNVPPYAILSHRWQGREITIEDMNAAYTCQDIRFAKINAFCNEAAALGVRWAWVDTCCIDRSNSSALSEAINSMFAWYSNAVLCLAFLSDVESDTASLRKSEWFERGWTLQELIASRRIAFYNSQWKHIGTKESLREALADITGIDEGILAGDDPTERSIAQRMAWAARRKTTRIEDRAYSLLGLFDISLPMIYGEGNKAFLRLQEEILRRSDDHSIFAWRHIDLEDTQSLENPSTPCGLLASSPAAFADCENVIQTPAVPGSHGYAMTNRGLSIHLPTIPYSMRTYLALLDCTEDTVPTGRLGILLERFSVRWYGRVRRDQRDREIINSKRLDGSKCIMRRILVKQRIADKSTDIGYGFWLRGLDRVGFQMDKSGSAQIFSRDPESPYSQDLPFVRIPDGLYGTAGVGFIPLQSRINPQCRVYCIKVGFDDVFCPACLLGNAQYLRGQPKASTHRTHPESSTTPGVQGREILFKNSWITYTETPKFEHNDNFCVLKGSGVWEVPFLDVQVSISLQNLPESLHGKTPFPRWWTVDILDSKPSSQKKDETIRGNYADTDSAACQEVTRTKASAKL